MAFCKIKHKGIIMELSEKVRIKLAEAIEQWADETLPGKPAIIANGVYANMCSFLEKKTDEINETFK